MNGPTVKPFRVLLISNVRPSRSWNFANRITREVPVTAICGIVQRPLRSIPTVQQQIARHEIGKTFVPNGLLSKARMFLSSIASTLVGTLLWFIHGCPINPNNQGRLTTDKLSRECARMGWPLLVMLDTNSVDIPDSIRREPVDLVILLGDFPSAPELPVNSLNGCIRASFRTDESSLAERRNGALVRIEHLTRGSETPCTVASVSLQWQPYDGLLGFTLKADLLADDLLLHTAASLQAGNLGSTPTVVQQWAERILAPCLRQFQEVSNHVPQNGQLSKHCRSKWKLCMDTLLLCSPWILARNWYRRCKKQYPVLILAHHLISDRPHRMGMPTEMFFQHILFLQKHYRIVSLSEAVELLRSGELRVPTVALTFDDGYADNFLNLRAVANETGISATLFITTHPVEAQQEFGHDLSNGMTGFFPLTWDQIQYWSTRGVEFGSHTRTHMDCGTPDSAKLSPEIIGSKDDLEAQLGKSVALFAFPFGQRENMSSEAMRLAASAYSHFVSSFGGEGPSSGKNLQSHLFRKNFYASKWELELELQSVFDFAGAIRKLFSRSEKEVADQEAIVPISPKLNTSLTTAANQHVVDRRAFRRDSEKAGYRSSLL